MLQKILRNGKLFFLNPYIFFLKAVWLVLRGIAPSPKGVVQANVGGYHIDVIPSRNYWWKSMYYGYCGVEIVYNIRKFLRPGGVFIDVGAGVGYFSAIASEIAGNSGHVHSFEPFPGQVDSIRKMIGSKPDSNIVHNDCALGAEDGIREFYLNRDGKGWSCSMIKGFVTKVDETYEVRTQRLDAYLRERKIENVSLIKIDVEGYEYNVLKGLEEFLTSTKVKPPIICEIAVPPHGYSLSELQEYMMKFGYRAHNIYKCAMRVDLRELSEMTDVVFLPA